MVDLYPKPGTFFRGAVPPSLVLPGSDEWGRTMLKIMQGATGVAPGLRGAVPAPALGDQRRAFTGGGSYSNELEIAFVTDADGLKRFDFEAFGDCDNRPYSAAAGAGSHRGRFGVKSITDLWADLQLEPNAAGEVTNFGDILQTTLRGSRHVTNVAYGTAFTAHGLPVPTVSSPGAAPAALVDANGSYVSLTYDFGANAAAGLSIGPCLRRGHNWTLLYAFRSAFVQSRFWFGAFSGNPSGSATLGSIKGVGIRMDAASDSNTLKLVSSDGGSQNEISMGINPGPNAIQCLRLRHRAGGHWFASSFNFTSLAWEGVAETTVNEPATGDDLGIEAWLAETSTSDQDRAMSPMMIALV